MRTLFAKVIMGVMKLLMWFYLELRFGKTRNQFFMKKRAFMELASAFNMTATHEWI